MNRDHAQVCVGLWWTRRRPRCDFSLVRGSSGVSLRADFVLGGAHVEGHIQLLIQLYHSISYPNSLICAGDISGGTEDISARIFRRQRRETEDISRTRVRAIVCRWHPLCDCAPGAHPQENLSYPAGPLLFLGVLG